MKTNRLLPDLSIKKIWDRLTGLENKYGYLGEVSSLDSIPVNYMGSVGLTADISPTTKAATFTVNAFGASERRRTIQVINNATGYMYQCCKNSDAWVTWERFVGESEFNEVSSELTVKEETLTDGVLSFSVDKIGGVKMLRCSGYPTEDLVSGNTYTIGTLSNDFKPKRSVNVYMINNNICDIRLLIYSGVIKIVPQGAISTSTGVNILLTYI